MVGFEAIFVAESIEAQGGYRQAWLCARRDDEQRRWRTGT